MRTDIFSDKLKSLKGFLKGSLSSAALSIKSFGGDTRGNFAVLFSMATVPIMGFAGLAIEFTRYSMVNENLTNALDASGLAISQRATALGYEINSLSDSQKDELKQYGVDFFYANFSTSAGIAELEVDFTFSTTTVKPTAVGYMNTSLMGLLGVDSFDLSTDTEITLQGAGKLELALVLDVTGSMSSSSGGGTRMSVLKEAVDDMLDTLYGTDPDAVNDQVKVAVVPFNTVVNTGGLTNMDNSWLDLDAQSMYHGNTFFHTEDPFDIDLTKNVNLFKLFDSIGTESGWKGCVESRPFPLDEMDTEPGSAVASTEINTWDDMPSGVDPSVFSDVSDAFNNAPSLPYSAAAVGDVVNSRFVPFFYPDHPDCAVTSGKDACNYYMSGSSSPGYMYDDINQDGDYESSYDNRKFVRDWQYTNMSYGDSDARVAYNKIVCQYRYNWDGRTSGGCSSLPLVNDDAWDVIVPATQATNVASDEYRIRQAYPGIYNPATEKYEGKYDLTVSVSENGELAGRGPNQDCSTELLPLTTKKKDITDTIDALVPGGFTNSSVGAIWGWRVLSPEAPFTEGVDTNVDTDWRKAIVIMTDGRNTVNSKSGSHNGSDFEAYGHLAENRLNLSANAGDYEDEYNRKTIRICHRMQAEGIKVYTVGFSISAGSDPDKMLKACATEPEGEDATYYLAEDADELLEAFQAITEDLVNLHISG